MVKSAKKVLSVILAVIIAFSTLGCVFASASYDDCDVGIVCGSGNTASGDCEQENNGKISIWVRITNFLHNYLYKIVVSFCKIFNIELRAEGSVSFDELNVKTFIKNIFSK